MRHTFHALKRFKNSFSLARLHAGRQAVSFASLRRSSTGSELFEFCAFLGGIFFRSRVAISCSRVSCFLCCSEDGLALFWRLGALRVAVLTTCRSRLLIFRILRRGGFLLGAFSAGPAPPFVQLWARVEVRSGSVAKLSLGTVAPFSSIRFSFGETVAGMFGCAVERSGAKSHVAEFLAIAGACGMVSR